jgi:hypothetical protein
MSRKSRSAPRGFFGRLWQKLRGGGAPEAGERPLGYDLLGTLDRDLDPEALPSARQQVAHASLLESLRALATDLPVPTVVLAGVADEEAAREVIAGLMIQAHLRGLHVTLGKLTPGQGFRVLRKRIPHSGQTSTDVLDESFDGRGPGALPLEIVGAPAPEALRAWYEKASADSDLLLLEAPPMLRSVDAALLGRACDGLVLVAECLITRQEELEIAFEKARAAGSPPIGLVINEHQEWLPRTLRKFLPTYPRSVRPPLRPPQRANEPTG